jgi:hypothetical protein
LKIQGFFDVISVTPKLCSKSLILGKKFETKGIFMKDTMPRFEKNITLKQDMQMILQI